MSPNTESPDLPSSSGDDGEGGSGRVTIARIAAEAGVSMPTVSKVINGRADVARETRDRVEAIIRRHGYQRRIGDGTRRSDLLELVFHELDSEWALELIRGVQRVAEQEGLAVVVSELPGHRSPGRNWVESLLSRRPTAVISVFGELGAEHRAQLAARDIPLVVVDPAGDPGPDVPAIGATNWHGGLTATRHLIGLGHRRIAAIGGPDGVLCSRARLDGYRAALDAAGVPVDPDLVRHGDFQVTGGRREFEALLALPDPPTAVFAGSDLQAIGVYQAAGAAGLRIPEDLSVVGFDDLPAAQWLNPTLTTVRQPLQEMAAAATRLAVSLSRGEDVEHRNLDLATSLVVRHSTAAPR